MHTTLALILVFTCCAPAAAQFSPPADPPAASGPELVDACKVIARIDNQVILACDILWEANLILNDNRDRIPPDRIEEAREQIMENQLRSYIDTKLLYADFQRQAQHADMNAIREQLDEPFYSGGKSGNAPGSVPALMKAVEAENIDQLRARLAELGTSLSDRKEAYVEKAIAQSWLQEQIDVQRPTHDELVEHYQEHLDDYAYPDQARWEELAVRYSNHPNPQAAREKLVQAGNVAWKRWNANPDSTEPLLADIAQKYSEAYNASEGGLNDWTTKGALRDEELDKALFSLPIGTLSPILESNAGLHIIRVVERREAGHTPFLEVQDEIRDQLMNERFREQTQKLVERLRRETRIWTVYTGDTTAEAFLSPPDAPTRR